MKKSDHSHLKRNLLAGAFMRVLGHSHNALALTDDGIRLFGKNSSEKFSFDKLTGPVEIKRNFLLASVALPIKGRTNITSYGFSRTDAKKFVSATNTAWKDHIAEKITTRKTELATIADAVRRLKKPKRFPSACLVEPYLERAKRVLENLPNRIPLAVLSADLKKDLQRVIQFKKSATAMRQLAIDTFMKTEMTEMKDFFESIESRPLTPEQREAVITDEDATLIPAGAGSGKTSVIVAKAAYLIERKIRQPAEILLMTFTRNAAGEMADRVKKRSGAQVDSMTFHALGNRIIEQVEGKAPQLAAHASDDWRYYNFIHAIVFDIVKQSRFSSVLDKWFSEFHSDRKSAGDFKTKKEYDKYVESHELRTLRRELVKSFEELKIANWLYLKGIDYEYEPDYEHDLKKPYKPDFRLTKSGIYIEHFGIRKSQKPGGGYTTRPDIDRKKYLAEMKWKRGIHKKHNTVLVESFSYEQVEGVLLKNLEEKLAAHGIKTKPIPVKQMFDVLKEQDKRNAFTQSLSVFLRHFKSTGITMEKCLERAERSGDGARAMAFLKIFAPLYAAYQKKLSDENRIDFEDMISLATKYVESGQYTSPYRHLIVDEFQDISQASARLLKALKAQHRDARIFAVGDDWQSIYRFSGADIHLMADFGAEFGGVFAGKSGIHRRVDLTRTFRSVDKIALPARDFVLQNPSQIEKKVNPAGKADAPAIKVAYYAEGEEQQALDAALGAIKPPKAKVLLLGRYNHQRPGRFPRHSGHAVEFMTVHKAKGLEADHVVILGANAGQMGFPCEIVDEPLLNLVLPVAEIYEYAEERRLFYVALTRARKSVTILTDESKPSGFVGELVEGGDCGVVEV